MTSIETLNNSGEFDMTIKQEKLEVLLKDVNNYLFNMVSGTEAFMKWVSTAHNKDLLGKRDEVTAICRKVWEARCLLNGTNPDADGNDVK
jgi:hypothetical protein